MERSDAMSQRYEDVRRSSAARWWVAAHAGNGEVYDDDELRVVGLLLDAGLLDGMTQREAA